MAQQAVMGSAGRMVLHPHIPPLETATQFRRHHGLSESEFRRAVSAGTVIAVRRGLYAPSSELTPEARHILLATAVARRMGPNAVLSHVSAAVLWNLPVDRHLLGNAWVTQTSGAHGRRTAGLRTFATALPASDVDDVGGFRVTSAARTTIDTARVSREEWAVAIADAALKSRLVTRAQLVAGCVAATTRSGVGVARRAVSFADERAESPLESISRLQMDREGVPAPVLQYPIRFGGRFVARVDFAWPQFGVVGECDGMVKYGALLSPDDTPQQVIMREKAREDLIRQAGWWIVRWDWSLAGQPALLAERIRGAFELGRPRSWAS